MEHTCSNGDNHDGTISTVELIENGVEFHANSTGTTNGSEYMEKNVGLDCMNRLMKVDTKKGWGLYTQTNEECQWSLIMLDIGVNKIPIDLKREDLLGKRFKRYDEAELFFTLYAKAMGFSVRKSHKRTTVSGDIKNRTWLCAKEGYRHEKFFSWPNRKKEARCLTREGCQVKFRVNFSKKEGVWIVKEFVTDHSHPLAIASHIQFLRSSKEITGGALQTAKSMKGAGIRTCQIMRYIARQVGGFDNVRFVMKDLYNKLDRSGELEVNDTDAAKALGFLQHKCEYEDNFFGKYSLDSEGRLQNILWADSQSSNDYKLFGHALAFDTTYRSNKYSKPFLVLVGVNHHFRTVIFAMALLIDETKETYRWALETFLECMSSARPRTVITDGDLAMRGAIEELMPETVHRLCSLHLHHNAISNIKDCGFALAFKKLMFRRYTPTEFQRQWKHIIHEFGLQNNTWVASIYERREQWADTFLRGHFFAGMRTTQRSEGMHAFLKSKIKSSVKLTDFVMGMDHAIMWLRHKEAEDEFNSSNSRPVTNVTNMVAIEEQFAELYTKEMFLKVREEIKKEGAYMAEAGEAVEEMMRFQIIKYATQKQVRLVVVKDNEIFQCDCDLFPTTGIPCRHIFATLKRMHITRVPETLLCNRWMKKARGLTYVQSSVNSQWSSIENKEAKFGHLISKCSELAFIASGRYDLFRETVKEIEHLTAKLNGKVKQKRTDTDETQRVGVPNFVPVQNPECSTTKGGYGGTKFGGKTKKR